VQLVEESRYLLLSHPMKRLDFFARRLAALIAAPYYYLKFRWARPKEKLGKRYYASICAIFRDESPYLRQWIEYHLIVGFEHFYLYNNFSEDDYGTVLKGYIDNGVVTLIDWPIKQGQMAAFKDCANRFASETQWIAFIDLDEYVVPNHYDNICDFLRPFELKRPVIIGYWRYFGSSGRVSRDVNGLIIEDFVVCWKKYSAIGKCFFNTSYEYLDNYRGGYMHEMWARRRGVYLPPVNCFGRPCVFGVHSVPTDDLPVQINHYLLKSYEEYIGRKSRRGGGVHDQGFHNMDYYWGHEYKSQEIDVHAYKYLVELKLRLEMK